MSHRHIWIIFGFGITHRIWFSKSSHFAFAFVFQKRVGNPGEDSQPLESLLLCQLLISAVHARHTAFATTLWLREKVDQVHVAGLMQGWRAIPSIALTLVRPGLTAWIAQQLGCPAFFFSSLGTVSVGGIHLLALRGRGIMMGNCCRHWSDPDDSSLECQASYFLCSYITISAMFRLLLANANYIWRRNLNCFWKSGL